MERYEFLEILKDSYSAYYNILPGDNEKDLPLAFRAEYFSRAEQYWLSKKITVWANETNEFAYIFAADSFDSAMVEKCVAFALEEALPRVKPHKEHQYSNVKLVFVAESWDKETLRCVEKQKFEKNYKFGLHGFTMLKTAAVSLAEKKAFTNRAGYELAKYFSKLFASADKMAEGESK